MRAKPATQNSSAIAPVFATLAPVIARIGLSGSCGGLFGGVAGGVIAGGVDGGVLRGTVTVGGVIVVVSGGVVAVVTVVVSGGVVSVVTVVVSGVVVVGEVGTGGVVDGVGVGVGGGR